MYTEKNLPLALRWQPYDDALWQPPVPKTAPAASVSAVAPEDSPVRPSALTEPETRLAWDIINHPERRYAVRAKMIGMSVRQLNIAREGLLQHNYIIEARFGQSLLLVPTPDLFSYFSITAPYRREVSLLHSFAVLVTARLLGNEPQIERVVMEASLGDANSTVDILSYLRDGRRWAYEITLHVSNVTANIAKLQDKGLNRIILLARDYQVKEAAWASIRAAGFDQDYLHIIRCQLFGKLLQEYSGGI